MMLNSAIGAKKICSLSLIVLYLTAAYNAQCFSTSTIDIAFSIFDV